MGSKKFRKKVACIAVTVSFAMLGTTSAFACTPAPTVCDCNASAAPAETQNASEAPTASETPKASEAPKASETPSQAPAASQKPSEEKACETAKSSQEPTKEKKAPVLKDGKYKIDLSSVTFSCDLEAVGALEIAKQKNLKMENGYYTEKGSAEKFGLEKTIIVEVKGSQITTYYNLKDFSYFESYFHISSFMSGMRRELENGDSTCDEVFPKVIAKDENGMPKTLAFTGSISLKSMAVCLCDKNGKDFGCCGAISFDFDMSSFIYCSENGDNTYKMTDEEKKAFFELIFKDDVLFVEKIGKLAASAQPTDTNAKDSNKDDSPKTGDSSSTGIMIAIIAGGVAVVAIVVVIIMKKKKGSADKEEE